MTALGHLDQLVDGKLVDLTCKGVAIRVRDAKVGRERLGARWDVPLVRQMLEQAPLETIRIGLGSGQSDVSVIRSLVDVLLCL